MKRIFSGVQPTGPLHLGNYLGALRNWVELQKEYESFFCIVNLHAITTPVDPAYLTTLTLELARFYLRWGLIQRFQRCSCSRTLRNTRNSRGFSTARHVYQSWNG